MHEWQQKKGKGDKMTQIGTWSKSRGSILITIPKGRVIKGNKKADMKIKYLGDKDDPFSPESVERDLEHDLNMVIVLQPTSSRGGKIITP
jgi:hypothetical protein